jgi:hypothetical protein
MESDSVFRSWTAAILIACTAASAQSPSAGVPPYWWESRGVTAPNASAKDFGAATQGQLKLIASRAFDELHDNLDGGSGPAVEAIVKQWYVTDGSGNFTLDGTGNRIPKVTANTRDFAPVTVGQLKVVAKPFFDRLRDTHHWPNAGYPWDQATESPQDSAMANIGQLKSLFRFNLSEDTDFDGMPDWWERKFGLNVNLANDRDDSDGDGLYDMEEYLIGANPSLSDTDGDGMPDGYEYYHGLNPLVNDANGDIDGDTITNYTEYYAQLDSDNDQMLNGWEIAHGLDCLDPSDASSDLDSDGLSNVQEYLMGTNPANLDTDGDHMKDGWEFANELDPLVPDADGDPDGDGLTNGWEYKLWTLPQIGDSDKNGVSDPLEDHDGDGITSGAEIASLPLATDPFAQRAIPATGTWPDRTDTNANGVNDGFERDFTGKPGLMLQEIWAPIGGTEVSLLTSLARYPGRPNTRSLVPGAFSSPSSPSPTSNYGERLRGTLTIPATDSYAFYFTADDAGECWMRTPSINGNQWFRAGYILGTTTPPSQNSTDSDTWPGLRYPVGHGTGVTLAAGAKIEIDIRHKLNSGTGFAKLRWRTVPNGGPQDIPASLFTSWTPPTDDTDADGLPDWWEHDNFGNFSSGPNDDPDGDGWTNLTELKTGTSPKTRDSDDDGLDEGGIYAFGLVLAQLTAPPPPVSPLDNRPGSNNNASNGNPNPPPPDDPSNTKVAIRVTLSDQYLDDDCWKIKSQTASQFQAIYTPLSDVVENSPVTQAVSKTVYFDRGTIVHFILERIECGQQRVTDEYTAFFEVVSKPDDVAWVRLKHSAPNSQALPWTNNNTVPPDPGSIMIGPDPVLDKGIQWYFAAAIIDVDIENGPKVDRTAGAMVPDPIEESTGAFTVANKNDTDGNGTIDNVQTSVTGEIDTIAMTVAQTIPYIGDLAEDSANAAIKLKRESGQAEIWGARTKGTKLADPLLIPLTDLPKTVFMESTETSAKVRDIVYSASLADGADVVKATGVWVDFVEERHGATERLWDEFESPPFEASHNLGLVSWIVANPPHRMNGMAIGFKFQVRPSGAMPGVVFDVTRQIEARIWVPNFPAAFQTNIFWPGRSAYTMAGPTSAQIEQPNDDGKQYDEDNTPSASGFIFSADIPTIGSYDKNANLPYPFPGYYGGNFLEWVRVSFDGQQPSGNSIRGSKASVSIDWKLYMWNMFQRGSISIIKEDVGRGYVDQNTPPPPQ